MLSKSIEELIKMLNNSRGQHPKQTKAEESVKIHVKFDDVSEELDHELDCFNEERR